MLILVTPPSCPEGWDTLAEFDEVTSMQFSEEVTIVLVIQYDTA